VPVHFTVTAPDGSFVVDQSVRVELLDANGTVVAGPLLWSSTPSSGVTASDGVYLANLDTSKDAAADYTLRVSFSSPTLTGSFTRTLSLVGGNATAQHPNR
jgi:hypothetical protein